MTIDMCAMEEMSPRFFLTSGSSNNVFDSDNIKSLPSTETDGESKKWVLFRKSRSGSSSHDLSSSQSSSKESQESLKKSSKSKKDTSYQEKQKKETLALFKHGDTHDILSLLYPDFNISDEEGRTPLTLVIQSKKDKNAAIITALLSRSDIDVNKADKWGNTPLHYAALQHNSFVINSLLDDPRVDSLITNKESSFAYQFLVREKGESDQDFLALRAHFFVKFRLDSVVRDTLPKALKGNALDDAVIKVKQRIASDATQDQPLPEKVQSPIKDELIKKIIICRWGKQDIRTSQETEIRNNTIMHGTEIVNDVINHNASVTDNFIAHLRAIEDL